jgi:transposase
MTELGPLAAVIGIDWADQHHDVAVQEVGTPQIERLRLAHTPEAIAEWLAGLRTRFAHRRIGIAVETSRGPLIHALLDHDFVVLYPVNPRSLKRFRETFSPSGAKDDVPDADLLREMLVKHRDRLRAWEPEHVETRALRRLVENRRRSIDLRTKLTQQLTATLKEYFPQALAWAGEDLSSALACDFLLTWPTLEAVQRARRKTVEAFYTAHNCRRPERIAQRLDAIYEATPLTRDPAIVDPSVLVVQMLARQLKTLADSVARFDAEIAHRFAAHEDAALFSALPGSGAALAPRLLVAFGADRARSRRAAEVQQYSGISPVMQRSGNSRIIHWRWAAPTFVRQTFHEFANQSIRYSSWARAYYALQRSRGNDHHAAVRALAFKWIRIIWRCWQEQTLYDEARYTRSLLRHTTPLTCRLANHIDRTKAA